MGVLGPTENITDLQALTSCIGQCSSDNLIQPVRACKSVLFSVGPKTPNSISLSETADKKNTPDPIFQLSAWLHWITIILSTICIWETAATTLHSNKQWNLVIRSQDINSNHIQRKCFHPREEGQIIWQSLDEHILTADDLRGFTNCQWLTLYSMNISDIRDGALSSLPKMGTLSFKDNKLKSLRKAMFQGSIGQELESLRFTNNSITSIEKSAFGNLQELEFLYLDHNPVGNDITAETFEGLSKKFFVLDLSYTNVSLVPGLFQHIPGLSVLESNGNPFKYVPKLWEGVGLRTLQLNYCNITELKREMFDGLEEDLTELGLQGNNFETIGPHSFNGLEWLFVLHLENSGIQHIQAKAFEGTPDLTLIYLWRNPIITIDENIFGVTIHERPDYQKYHLNLGPDVFHCSEGICWLRDATRPGGAIKSNDFRLFKTQCENINMTVIEYFRNNCP